MDYYREWGVAVWWIEGGDGGRIGVRLGYIPISRGRRLPSRPTRPRPTPRRWTGSLRRLRWASPLRVGSSYASRYYMIIIALFETTDSKTLLDEMSFTRWMFYCREKKLGFLAARL